MAASDLEIDDDLKWGNHIFLIQRIGWAALALFVIAAIAGVFGQSDFLTNELKESRSKIVYSKFGRESVDMKLELDIENPPREISVWINQDYLDQVTIENSIPEPVRSEPKANGVVYYFPVADGEKLSRIILKVKPTEWGAFDAHVRVSGGDLHDEFKFNQIIYF